MHLALLWELLRGVRSARRRLSVAMLVVRSVRPVAEHMHQWTGEHHEERQELHQMLVVTEEQPGDSGGEADPQQPLVDAGPVRVGLAGLIHGAHRCEKRPASSDYRPGS